MYELFDDRILDEAVHGLYALALDDVRREAGLETMRGGDIYWDTPRRADPEPLRRIAAYWLGRIGERWGVSVRTAFANAGVPEADYGDALHYLFMGGVGHGVGFRDKYGWALQALEEKDARSPIQTFRKVEVVGLHLDDSPVHELAYEDVRVELTEAVS